jgi:hypothetical protein
MNMYTDCWAQPVLRRMEVALPNEFIHTYNMYDSSLAHHHHPDHETKLNV